MEDNKRTDAIVDGSSEQSYDGPVVPVENVAKPKPKAKPRVMANVTNNNQYEGQLVTDPPCSPPSASPGLTTAINCDVTRRHSGSSVQPSNGIAEGADNDASYFEELSAATEVSGDDAVVKVKSKTKPLAPPRPNRAFQKSFLSSEMGGSLPKLDDGDYAGQPKPRPVPKPKPRHSLTPNIPRSPSYEEGVENGMSLKNMNLETSAGVQKTGTLVRSLSRSADDLLTLQLEAEQSGASGFTEMSALESVDRQVLKPSRAAPPRPLPKPQSSKIQEAMQLADRLYVTSSPDVSVSQPSPEEQVSSSDNSISEPRSAGVETKDRFGSQLSQRSANSFRFFNFLTRTDSANKSVKRSSVFYQQENATSSPISGSQSMPGYLNQLSHLNCEEEDSFDESVEDVEIANQKTPADVGGDSSRRDSDASTSLYRRGSDSTASFGSGGHNGLNLSHSGTGLNDSYSPQTCRDSTASSPASQVEFSFEGMDEEARAARLEALRKKAYNVAKEIVDTERTFVEHLILVNGSFREAVTKAVDSGGRPVITDDVLNQIIRYLPQLQDLSSNLLADLEDRLAKWAVNPTIADIFVKKGPFLKMYTDYIRDYEEMVAMLDDARARNPDFNKAVTEFEQLPACRGLGVRHHMLKPIQRIPQYRLLLKEYIKQQTRDSPDYENTKAALKIVSEVAEHANQRMKYLEESKHLKEIQAALGNQFEVIKPGRSLVKEGILNKLSRKEMQPRMFFLFNDVLLYTTPSGYGYYKLNNVLNLNSMRLTKNFRRDNNSALAKVSRPANEEFQNEFSIVTTQRSFTIQARSEQERVEWLTTLETAIKAALHKKLTHTQSKHLPSDLKVEVDTSKIKIGHVAPVWIPDDRVTKCALCAADFSITFRRHHCRGCGKVVCGSCSDYRAPLRYLDYRADRVCSECFDTLERALVKMSDTEYVTCPGSTMNGIVIKYTKEDLRAMFRGYPLHRSRSSAKSTVLSEVSANDKTVDASGYLRQWKNKSWKRMWFVVKNMVLYWYKASEDTAAEGSMPLIGYDVLPFNTKFQDVDKDFLFELHHKNLQSIIFRAENVQSRDRWMVTMRQATVPR